MNKKKIIIILFLILSLSFVLTGCSAIGELKTETIVGNYLESEDGPESVVKQSLNQLFAKYSSEGRLNDYEWTQNINLKDLEIMEPVADQGTGILTAGRIRLIFDYTINGDPQDSDLKPINKGGTLTYEIDSLTYDNKKEELVSMTETPNEVSDANSESPVISGIKTENSKDDGNGFSLTANLDTKNVAETVGIISLGKRYFSGSTDRVLDITNNQLSLVTQVTLAETDFASIMVINYDELTSTDSGQTGLAAALIAVP